jgi:hypothetical protein
MGLGLVAEAGECLLSGAGLTSGWLCLAHRSYEEVDVTPTKPDTTGRDSQGSGDSGPNTPKEVRAARRLRAARRPKQ